MSISQQQRVRMYGVNWEHEARKLQALNADLVAALRSIWDMQGNSAIGEIARAALAKVDAS